MEIQFDIIRLIFARLQFGYRIGQRAAVAAIRLAAFGDSARVTRGKPPAKLGRVETVPGGEIQLRQPTAPELRVQ